MATNRETARDQLTVWLNTYLLVPGLVKTVVGNRLTDTKGLFPIAYVKSAGTNRNPANFTRNYPTFYFIIRVAVQRDGQTDAAACDRIDAIEQEIANMCETETSPDLFLGYSDRSVVYPDFEVATGQKFYVEDIPIRYQIYTT